MSKRANEGMAKRFPEAPVSISDAAQDIQQLDVLLREMANSSTVIQKLIKSTIQNHWCQSIFWANRQGIEGNDCLFVLCC